MYLYFNPQNRIYGTGDVHIHENLKLAIYYAYTDGFVGVPVPRSEKTRFPCFEIGTSSILDFQVLLTDTGISSSIISTLMFVNRTHKNTYPNSVNI